ncbi:MAG: SDR family oxidoreductase [Acidimicrobiales bacterium]
MRVFVTGGSGFVGSNVVKVFAERHGVDVVAPSHGAVDLTDRARAHESIAEARPDAIVHCAILNDLGRLYADRRAAWDAYVGATRNVVDAANAVHAKVILVSTDWVFDGTQSGADERTPPNPINLYGVLKVASELVVTERAHDGAVARISGVNGVHWARPRAPRSQDEGFGYFVASIVDTLSAGRPFTVWVGDDINMIATPTLASSCAELMWRIVRSTGGVPLLRRGGGRPVAPRGGDGGDLRARRVAPPGRTAGSRIGGGRTGALRHEPHGGGDRGGPRRGVAVGAGAARRAASRARDRLARRGGGLMTRGPRRRQP